MLYLRLLLLLLIYNGMSDIGITLYCIVCT